ncbi:magnesium and cobalt transport protein CorA [Cryobacterium adonitolivorans]|uniref:Magnesium and cobalt transport protein CorA n=1 Tax=Cryobacterium adonitolivorans TaxID=1259189 RepID=A0A4R8WI12_9MICO|nr:magnesium and cobalt transport protein CorA [Cryobacterium adonitolivorans]TFC07089.1 magnesium and cobalt transport protein CorA [Cryobacterium adonitolivorans]
MSQRQNDGATAQRGRLFRRSGSGQHPPLSATTRRTRYVIDGRLSVAPADATILDALAFAQAGPDRIALCLFPAPTPEDVDELAEAWGLHPLLVEDLQHAGQRPKLERYGDVLYMVVRSARYLDEAEDVDFSEFHVLVRPHAIAVLCQDGRWIDGSDEAHLPNNATDVADHTLLNDEDLLRLGPEAVLYRLLDAIVDGYTPVLRGLAIDKEQIERQVFSGDAAVAERIYRLSQEVIDLQHATSSLTDVIESLRKGFDRYGIPEPLQTYLQDVADHLARAEARDFELRDALSQILSVNATLVAQRQNEDMKKISGWAAILFAPTLIAAVYGMNFDEMPELHWAFGYPLAVGGMVTFALTLYLTFRRKKWM